MNCLVTGGAGFIGSHVSEALVSRGAKVTVLDDFSRGSVKNLEHISNRIRLIKGNIRNEKLVKDAMKGVQFVFHLAAMVSVPESVRNPKASALSNGIGTLNIVHSAAQAGVKRLIFSSSAAIYGNQPVPHAESLTPLPQTPYAAHKLLGEHYGKMYRNLYGLETISLRYFNVYGPGQRFDSPYSGVISIFLDNIMNGHSPTIFGDGEQTRDFIHVREVARANILATQSSLAADFAINIGSGVSHSVNSLFDTLKKITGKQEIKAHYALQRTEDIKNSQACTILAKEKLGFVNQINLENGLKETWDLVNIMNSKQNKFFETNVTA